MRNPFSTRIRKIGTSFGVIIPIEMLRGHNLQRGDFVAFGSIDPDTIAIRKLSKELLDQINIPVIKI